MRTESYDNWRSSRPQKIGIGQFSEKILDTWDSSQRRWRRKLKERNSSKRYTRRFYLRGGRNPRQRWRSILIDCPMPQQNGTKEKIYSMKFNSKGSPSKRNAKLHKGKFINKYNTNVSSYYGCGMPGHLLKDFLLIQKMGQSRRFKKKENEGNDYSLEL